MRTFEEIKEEYVSEFRRLREKSVEITTKLKNCTKKEEFKSLLEDASRVNEEVCSLKEALIEHEELKSFQKFTIMFACKISGGLRLDTFLEVNYKGILEEISED